MTLTTRLRLVSGLCCGVLAAPALASISLAPFAQPEPPARPVTIFAFDHAGLGSMLVDAKDQKLKEAIEMIPARIKELPFDFPEMRNIPMPIVELVMSVLSNPGRLAVTFDPTGQEHGAMGFGLVGSVTAPDQNAASDMHGRVGSLLRMGELDGGPRPSSAYRGMSEIDAPFGGVIRYGPRQVKDRWNYQVHVGAIQNPDDAFASLAAAPAPPTKGFAPVVSAHIDFAALNHVAQTFMPLIENAGPEAETAMVEFEKLGLLGDDAIKVTWRTGYTPDAHVGYTVVQNMKKHAREMGVSTTPLTAAHFAMIPADATVAVVASYDIKPALEALQAQILTDPDAAEQLEQFTGATGVDPFDDVLLCLGGVSGVYMSDSTGGSIASLVFFTALSDRPRFEAAHAKLMGFANAMLASHHDIRGRIRLRAWNDGDTRLHSIIFPGLPVPMEVTYALAGDWLVAGLTPQSALAAARQVSGKGAEGLRANKGLAALLPADKEVTSFSFIDTPRLMPDGYMYVSFLGSAIANLARSSTNDGREPGLVVPTFAELRDGAKPIVSFTYWKGDDQITESHADRSMLVNVSGVAGALSPFIPVIAAIIAAAGPDATRELDHLGDAFDNILLP